MTAYRRILKAFWFSAALSIILSVVIVATSVLDKTCPVVAAASGNTAVAAEKAVTPTDNVRAASSEGHRSGQSRPGYGHPV